MENFKASFYQHSKSLNLLDIVYPILTLLSFLGCHWESDHLPREVKSREL